MRAVIQRVVSANASLDGEVISSIGKGLCILLGISRDDTINDIDYMVKKILGLKIFEDDNSGKRWCQSVTDKNYEILCMSQITLYHTLKSGNRPDFHKAMAPELSKDFYQEFLNRLRDSYQPDKVKEGAFGKVVVIGIQNDGPVTIVLDSPDPKQENQSKQPTAKKGNTADNKSQNKSKTSKTGQPLAEEASSQTPVSQPDN